MQEFKILSDNNVDISLSRRWMGDEEYGIMDVYQLYMDVEIEDGWFCWALLIRLDKIRYLQEYIKMGIEALKKKIDGV